MIAADGFSQGTKPYPLFEYAHYNWLKNNRYTIGLFLFLIVLHTFATDDIEYHFCSIYVLICC